MVSQVPAIFRNNPARSLHAALLRRLELVVPDIGHALHDTSPVNHSTVHPWTVSSLRGHLNREGDSQVSLPGEIYHVRISALTPEIARALDIAFNPEHPLGREPLKLEHVPFAVISEQTYWEHLATYASLLTDAKPYRRIDLDLCSPTGFRSSHTGPVYPQPRTCVGGYLTKWNNSSEIIIPEESLLEFVEKHIVLKKKTLRSVTHRLGSHSKQGFVGRVEWQADDSSPSLLRLVNVLADYAFYCGTGMKTALGMGQTSRVRIRG